jgi:transposase
VKDKQPKPVAKKKDATQCGAADKAKAGDSIQEKPIAQMGEVTRAAVIEKIEKIKSPEKIKTRASENGHSSENEQEMSESNEGSAFSTASTVEPAREKFKNSKLSDYVESEICKYVANGLSYSDAARLVGIHRSTSWNWKKRGDAYHEDPVANAADERFGQFADRLIEAELKAKVWMIASIQRDPDWRAKAFLLKARYKEEFAEMAHLQSEVSGPNGSPLAMNPFQLNVVLQGPEKIDFRVIDHSQDPEQIARDKRIEDISQLAPALPRDHPSRPGR